jgi:Prp8 binding protein
MCIWNVKNGECVKALIGHEYAVNDLIIVDEGLMVSCSDDLTVRIWDLKAGELVRTKG